jgi:hypothetical protein
MIPAGASFAKPEIFYVPDHLGKARMYVGKDWGTTSGACKRLKPPLLVHNSAFLDRKLERTAIQIFAVTFPDAEFVSGLVGNSDSPSFWLPSLVLQRHVMKETEWRAIYEKVIK